MSILIDVDKQILVLQNQDFNLINISKQRSHIFVSWIIVNEFWNTTFQ